ncbi:MAG TPA: hypothetical protein VIZ70_01735 [Propionibacteriaceae bacterium]
MSVRQELIKERLEVCDGWGMDLDQKAIFASDAMTFADLRQ